MAETYQRSKCQSHSQGHEVLIGIRAESDNRERDETSALSRDDRERESDGLCIRRVESDERNCANESFHILQRLLDSFSQNTATLSIFTQSNIFRISRSIAV